MSWSGFIHYGVGGGLQLLVGPVHEAAIGADVLSAENGVSLQSTALAQNQYSAEIITAFDAVHEQTQNEAVRKCLP